MKHTDILIIGAGPAGMAAAVEAARTGAAVTLVDDNVKPGGQIYRQFHDGFTVRRARNLGPDYGRGQALIRELEAHARSIEILCDAVIWGLFPGREAACLHGSASFSIFYRKLIIAAGAYDRPVPFPGWTLPGVLTAGGAQWLIKNQQVLPGKRMLLAGTGPLQLALVSQIIKAGGEVVAIAEAADVDNWPGLINAAMGQWELVADGLRYLHAIRKARIPLMRRHIIVEARGDGGRVAEAVLAEVDGQWRPKPGTEKVFPADVVCSGYGFIPSSETALLAGCAHTYDPRLGGWIPLRTAEMRSSRADVYAAGDCSGVAGSKVAIEEGRIAGIFAAAAIGRLTMAEAEERVRGSRQKLASLSRFRAAVDAISVPRPGLYELAREDTILCRCQEITLGDLKVLMHTCSGDLNEVKRMTGMGMGPCQGRVCGQIIQEIVAREKRIPPAGAGFFSPRPPIKSVPLAALAAHA